MEVENLSLARDLFRENDKSKLDGQSFKRAELKSIFDTLISRINQKFRPLASEYEETKEAKLLEKNNLEAQNDDIVGKASSFRKKISNLNDRIKDEEEHQKKLSAKVEEERVKTRDVYKLPLWIFILFGFVAGLGELLSYYHMFQSQEYIINELTGKSFTGGTTAEGWEYKLLPLILGSSLVISIVFLSKFVGKVFKQLTDNDEYKKLSVLNEHDQKEYDRYSDQLATADPNSADPQTLKILRKEKKSLEKKPRYAKFRYIAFHKEIWLFAIIGTLFVGTIAYGATKLRESALKQQYNAAKLSIEINKSVNKLIASENKKKKKGFGVAKKGFGLGNTSGTLGKTTFGNSGAGMAKKAPAVDIKAQREAKFKEIESIYNSRAEGSIWFLFINGMMYMVGILLGYFSYTSNRQFEGAQDQLKRKTKELDQLHKKLKGIQKESSKFNKTKAIVKLKETYNNLLKELDENGHTLQKNLYELLDLLKLNYNEFVKLQILNDRNTDLTHEFAHELYDQEFTKLEQENRNGIFKYINNPIENFSHEKTWEELLDNYDNKMTKKGEVV